MKNSIDPWHPRLLGTVLVLGAILIVALLAARSSQAQERCRRNVKLRMTATLLEVTADGRVPMVGDPPLPRPPSSFCAVRISDERNSKGLQLDDCKGSTLLVAGGQ